jgi:uncharacterized protein
MTSVTSPGGTALVTGASSGIGAAFTTLLAERGRDVVVVARRKERLEAMAETLGARHGVRIDVLPADLTSSSGLRAVEERLATDARPIDLLVNNAGFGSSGSFASLDIEREEEMVRLNVIALVRLTHAALGGMLARGRGGIINVSSSAAFQPMPGWATYSSTKAFVSRFTESIAGETRGTGVVVTALCPGYTRTEFQDNADVDEVIPGFLWQNPTRVAAAALDALDRKRVYAVPGWPYRALEVATGLLPKTVVRAASRAVYRYR